MPRKKVQKAAEDMTKTADMPAITKAAKSADELNNHLATIDERYGDGQPYDLERYIDQAMFYLSQINGSRLMLGQRLLLIKEHEQHGNFLAALEKMKIPVRNAQRLMSVARKLTDPKLAALTVLNQSKILELMAEADDEDLEGLTEGDTIAGKTLDEIDKMTASELRAQLRKAREQREADAEVHEKLLESKDKKINKLHAQVHDRKNKTPEWDVRVKEYQLETTHIAATILESLDRLDVMRDAFLSDDFGDENDSASSAMAAVYYDSIRQITGRTAQVAEDCDTVFAPYAEEAMPMLDYWAEKFESK